MQITSNISTKSDLEETNSVKINTFGEEFEALLNYTPTQNIDKIFKSISYEETKSMTDIQIEDKYSHLHDEEIKHIKFMRDISNGFSHNEEANKAIFYETKSIRGDRERFQFSLELFGTKIKSATTLNREDSVDEKILETKGSISFDTKQSHENYTEDIKNETLKIDEDFHLDKLRQGKYSDHRLSEEDAEVYLVTMLEDTITKHDNSRDKYEKANLRKDIVKYTRILQNYISELENKDNKENQAILEQYRRNTKPSILEEKRVDI